MIQLERVTSNRLEAIADVFLEGNGNMNHYDFLIVGLHPGHPLKRSLLKFEDIPSICQKLMTATMYVYYWYGHKASFQTESQAPWIPRFIEARQVLKSWSETQATRNVRLINTPWSSPYLNLNSVDARSYADDAQTISRDTPSQYIPWNITPTARNWIAGQPNNGILLSTTNEHLSGRDIRFYSRRRPTNLVPYVDVLCTTGKMVCT